jgi:lysophospholipase L1-like esterase
MFFFEKKNQKTFATWRRAGERHAQNIKSFLLLFFKKEALALILISAAALPPAARPYSRMDLPWWRARFAAKQAELRQGKVDLIWLGDSITQNFETAGPEPWRNYQPIWQKFYAPFHAVNLGFKGDATAHLLWRMTHGELDGIHPRLAIILIGANNFGHLHWPAEPTLVGIETVVATLRARLPETKILLLGVLPSMRSAWVDANTLAVNRDLAARFGHVPNVTYRDLSSLFMKNGHVDPDDFEDPHLSPPDPPLHPSAQTQARMAEAIEPVVRQLMGDRAR